MVIAGAAAAYSTARMATLEAWVSHTFNVREAAQRLLVDLLEAESSQRGLAASGNSVLNEPFERAIGCGVLGNYPASGTEIIARLGEEHVRTGKPIVYTSADSVFQVAAHEDVIPLDELYRICDTARDILRGPWEVGRVIARPFTGKPGAFTRTANRHDVAVPPPEMLLDRLAAKGVVVGSVGKIFDVFLGRGIGPHVKTVSNADGMAKTLVMMNEIPAGLIYVNLVDFDRLQLHKPELVHDMPANGRRFVQRVNGYEATIAAGIPIFERGEHTGAMPGRLVRADHKGHR